MPEADSGLKPFGRIIVETLTHPLNMEVTDGTLDSVQLERSAYKRLPQPLNAPIKESHLGVCKVGATNRLEFENM